MISIQPSGQLYRVTFSHPDKAQFDILVDCMKEVGATWDKVGRTWVLAEKKRADVLSRCSTFCGTPAKLLECLRDANAKLLGLPPLASPPPVPEGMKLRAHQVGGVEFIAPRPGSLIAWEQRTGKSPFAVAAINAAGDNGFPAIVICPAHLKYKWFTDFKGDAEMDKRGWLLDESRTVGIAAGSYFPPTDVVIINYDILYRHKSKLDSVPWAFLFLDEPHSHMCNPKSKRTRAIYGGVKGRGKNRMEWSPVYAKRVVALTGTPISSKPQDMWPTLHYLDPKRWPSLHWFENTFCGIDTRDQWMKDRQGRAVCRKIRVPCEPTRQQMEALNKRLTATVMSRVRVRDVMDIPPVQRRVIEVDVGAGDALRAIDKADGAVKAQRNALRAAVEVAKATENTEEYANAVRELADFEKKEREHTAVLRQKVGLAKVPYVADHVRYILDADPGQKVLVFAHHHVVIEALIGEFSKIYGNGFVNYYGKTKPNDKIEAEKRIQMDPACRGGVLGITSAGEGLTLSGATWIVFAEEDGIPKNVRQCEARPWSPDHTNSYMVDHIVARGSTDARIAKLMVKRMAAADTALDSDLTLEEPIDWVADHQLPTDAELSEPVSAYQSTTYRYGLQKLVANPKAYNVSDLDLIIASRLAGRDLTGKAAAYAKSLAVKYLGESKDGQPIKLPER